MNGRGSEGMEVVNVCRGVEVVCRLGTCGVCRHVVCLRCAINQHLERWDWLCYCATGFVV